jgi:Lrp/AsnC family transcriptional regulator for asnA, asnC and gidA
MKPAIDELDRQIVDWLMADGRMSCSAIARAIGHVSSRAVRYRIDRLIEDKVIAIRPIVNPNALGYNIAADVFVQADPQRVEEVAEALSKLEEVNYVAITSGDRDIAVQVYTIDVAHLRLFMTKTLQSIPGVEHTKTYLLMQVLKDIDAWTIPSNLP